MNKIYGNILPMKNVFTNFTESYWLVFSIVLLVAFKIPASHAVEVKDLYVAKVASASQSRNDRNSALREALQVVLVKVGGHKSVLAHQAIKKNIRQYNNFVTNYSYERNNGEQFLRASFDANKINNLFINANLPIWGSLRPQVVLWLVNEEGFARQLLLDNDTSNLALVIEQFSAQRGLPITLPKQYLNNTDTLSIPDIWGRFQGPIAQASIQYLAEAVVIVRISDTTLLTEEQILDTDNCQLLCQPAIALDWSFISTTNPDDVQHFSERYYGVDRSNLLVEALGDITDDIYQRYALTTNENNQFEMDIANVSSLARYVEITNFLQQLSSVKSVKLVNAIGATRRFQLNLLGSEQALLASLKLNSMLKQRVDPLDPNVVQGVPLFYWEQP